ncbi:hypothetical protein ACFE04_022997 [Oxalis oulophora]
MASACINNISADNFPKPASYTWLGSRISLTSRDDVTTTRNSIPSTTKSKQKSPPPPPVADPVMVVSTQDHDGASGFDFEFRLDDKVTMLTADELFSDGKLMPLTNMKPPLTAEINSPEKETKTQESYLFSPKASRCTSRWREILGFKKVNYQKAPTKSEELQQDQNKTKLMKQLLLHKRVSLSPSSCHVSFNQSLFESSSSSSSSSSSISSSRLSLSSSSSSHDYDDLPRLSLDSDNPSPNPFLLQQRIRVVKSKHDSGRNLERSSSSPSSLNGGPRIKHRCGMERSYSANVRVTPVLNVAVCSLRGSSKSGSVFGFGPIFSSSSNSPHKRQLKLSSNSNGKNRTNRT